MKAYNRRITWHVEKEVVAEHEDKTVAVGEKVIKEQKDSLRNRDIYMEHCKNHNEVSTNIATIKTDIGWIKKVMEEDYKERKAKRKQVDTNKLNIVRLSIVSSGLIAIMVFIAKEVFL